jgi:hypothetical protein
MKIKTDEKVVESSVNGEDQFALASYYRKFIDCFAEIVIVQLQ